MDSFESSTPQHRQARLILMGGLVLVVLGFTAQIVNLWPQINDDAHITFRFSHNLARGIGPVWNPGEWVEGYTNPLMMLLGAAIIGVGGPEALPIMAKLISLVGALVMVGLAGWAAWWLYPREPDTKSAGDGALCSGILAAGIVGLTPFVGVNATTGLETTKTGALVLATCLTLVHTARTGRWLGAGLLWALALWSRPEVPVPLAAMWFGVVAVWALHREGDDPSGTAPFPKALIIDGVIAAVALAAMLGLRWHLYGGELVPNTYYAKGDGFTLVPSTSYVYTALTVPFLGLVGLLAGGVELCLRPSRSLGWAAAVGGAGLVGMLLPLKTGSDWMLGSRLTVPYLPLLAILVAIGWTQLLQRVRVTATIRSGGALLILLALWMYPESQRLVIAETVALQSRGYETGHGAVARFVGERTTPGHTVAVVDIGIIGFRNPDIRIIDISGLTDRHIAKSPGGFLHKEYDPAYILDQEPEFIVLIVTRRGIPYTPPDTFDGFAFLTTPERHLYNSDVMQARYVRDHFESVPEEGDWLTSFAHSVGAVAGFEHGYPRFNFVLLVFQRNSTDGQAE